ncbi:RDD family protein [Cellulophaga sp. L1A9]|uniref:RDD family protein n=1 Tax=Cellulophaga sp. L1A9 TaxID=2686362 RepID=UPI00131DC1F6|nr:RDD family protein [Cellulophaga sp. L1A9]
MEQFQIETAQNISISQNTAHLGDRMLAFLIDTLIIVAYYILVIILMVSLNLDGGDSWTMYMLFSLPPFLYYLLLETFNNGKTVGKSALKIRVVKLDGSNPTFANYFVRWILRILDISLSSGGVAVLTILLRGNGQRVGDMAAGTTVISEKKRISISDTVLRELPEDYVPRFPQVTVFSDREMQTIKQMYDDARRKGDHNVIVELSKKIKGVAVITTDLMAIEFVDIVIKDYSYYTQD